MNQLQIKVFYCLHLLILQIILLCGPWNNTQISRQDAPFPNIIAQRQHGNFFFLSFFLFNLIGNNPLFSNLRGKSGAVVALLKLESARRLTFADQQPNELGWHSWMQTSSAVNIVYGEWNSTATSLLFI